MKNKLGERWSSNGVAQRLVMAGIAFSFMFSAGWSHAQSELNDKLGLKGGEIVDIQFAKNRMESNDLSLSIAGKQYTLDYRFISFRSKNFSLKVQDENGELIETPAETVRTIRGQFRGVEGSRFVGCMMDSGLAGKIVMPRGRLYYVQPLHGTVRLARESEHIVYSSEDIVESEHTCGTVGDALRHENVQPRSDGLISNPLVLEGTQPTLLRECKVAVDADVEYTAAFGGAQATLDRMELIFNIVNDQYESEVGIRHTISHAVVRLTSADPYSSPDPALLVEQLRNVYQTSNVEADLFHLFTGRDINGNTIGRALDFGGVCNRATGYAFSSNIAPLSRMTDLVAHEMGHNWDARHCNCLVPAFTMNPSLTGANDFHDTLTVPEMITFRNSLGGCLDQVLPPDNNDWANRDVIPNTSNIIRELEVNINADTEEDENDLINVGSTAWWTWTAPLTGQITLDTFGSNFDTVLHLYLNSGSLSSNQLLAVNHNFNNTLQSQVSFTVIAGRTYDIRVGGWRSRAPSTAGISDGSEGSITLNGVFVPTPTPVNDDLANAIAIATPDFTRTGSNINATAETGEQDTSATGSTVWWSFVAPQNGMSTVDTLGSNFDTQLHIYAFPASGQVADLIYVDDNDDINETVRQSQVSFDVVAGQLYAVRVGGFQGGGLPSQGGIILNAEFIPSGCGMVTVANGEMLVSGTLGPDNITVIQSGDMLNVKVNNECDEIIPLTNVNHVTINSFGGADVIRVNALVTTSINGGFGPDEIIGGPLQNEIFGGPGPDEIFGGPVDDVINAGQGQDTVFAFGGDDIIIGGDASDTLHGGLGNDQVFGGLGQDTLFGNGGDDILIGNAGTDLIDGGPGNDELTGQGGPDTLLGGNGNDQLNGGAGFDTLNGGSGIDISVDNGEVEISIEQ